MLQSGIDSARIRVVGESKADTKKRGGQSNKKASLHNFDFIVCTRYKVLSEMKTLFDYTTTAQLQGNTKASFLFHKVPLALIKKLRHEYLVDKGKEQRNRHVRKEAPQDRVTRLIRESFGRKSSLTHIFETVVIDECHFLRNGEISWLHAFLAHLLTPQFPSRTCSHLNSIPVSSGLLGYWRGPIGGAIEAHRSSVG